MSEELTDTEKFIEGREYLNASLWSEFQDVYDDLDILEEFNTHYNTMYDLQDIRLNENLREEFNEFTEMLFEEYKEHRL